MAWFKKKPDLISDRARTLNSEIAKLEAEIKRLDQQLQANPPPPDRAASATVATAAAAPASTLSSVPVLTHTARRPGVPVRVQEPIFEDVGQGLLKTRPEGNNTPAHYNELGVRKYDLPALLRRIRNHFRGPSTTNPKLVSYLAAGGIQGLRPLRYEKRVARNRFIFLVTSLFLMLLGLIWVILHR